MKQKNELAGSLCAEQFQDAIRHTQIASKSKEIAYAVLVDGNSITSVAKRNNITLINLPHLSYYSPFTKNIKKKEAIEKLLKYIN